MKIERRKRAYPTESVLDLTPINIVAPAPADQRHVQQRPQREPAVDVAMVVMQLRMSGVDNSLMRRRRHRECYALAFMLGRKSDDVLHGQQVLIRIDDNIAMQIDRRSA